MGRDLKEHPVPIPAGSCHLRAVLKGPVHTQISLWQCWWKGGGILKGINAKTEAPNRDEGRAATLCGETKMPKEDLPLPQLF